MNNIVIASNRGPLSFQIGPDSTPKPAASGGGLAATLHLLLAGTGATWVSAAMSDADRLANEQGLMTEPGMNLYTISPDPATYRMAYDVISNGTLWFCHHHLFDLARRPRFDHRWQQAWDAYRTINEAFANAIVDVAPKGATVLVQDYHLCLTGSMLADSRPDLVTVHFTHTPFGDPNALRVLPSNAAGELLAGMAGFDACGFHSTRWEDAFRAAFDDPELRQSSKIDRPPVTFVSPLGPDPDAIISEAASIKSQQASEQLSTQVGSRRLIVRVDRIELSKNILRSLYAFDELLEKEPQWQNQVIFLVLAYPSRQGLADYLSYRNEIEYAVDRINQKWHTDEWLPILLDVADDYHRSLAALSSYDVLIVNPIRDGLNLVAKEGPLVNKNDGVVILSREAGAFAELSSHSIGINPFDVSETADAMHRALAMETSKRAQYALDLRNKVLERTAGDWLAEQISVASRMKANHS